VTWDRTTVYISGLEPSGTLATPQPIVRGGPVRALDLDGDGKDELLVTTPGDSLTILGLNPNGQPVGHSELLSGRLVDTRDIDGDGRPELLLAHHDGELSIAWNTVGRFRRVTDIGLRLPAEGTVLFADPDGSGTVVLVRIACGLIGGEGTPPATDTVTVYTLGLGDRASEAVRSLVPGGADYGYPATFVQATVAELDGLPGDDILVQYGSFASTLHVLHATGGGVYVMDDHVAGFGPEDPTVATLGDWDGDGHLDALAAIHPESMDSMLQFCWNDGHGALLSGGGRTDPTSVWLGPGGAYAPVPMDLDGDGAEDLVFPALPQLHSSDVLPSVGVLFGRREPAARGRHATFAAPGRTEPTSTTATAPLHLVSLARNPVHSEFTVRFSAASGAGPVTIDLLDLAGRRVTSAVVAPAASGEATWSYDTRGQLPAGIYWLRLRQAASSVGTRVVLLR